MWFALAPIVMLFTAFGSAYIVRQGLSDDWQAIKIPRLLWWNSAVLLASSVTMELARRAVRPPAGSRLSAAARLQLFPLAPAVKKWLLFTLALGVLFLAGQLIAWRQLAAQGIYLSSNPSSSFFYLLTDRKSVV